MGWSDYLSDIPIVGGLASPPKNVSAQPGAVQGAAGAAQQVLDPGTGQPTGQWVAPNGQPLARDPVTGGFVDPSTGNAYGADGAATVNPNVAQQVAQNSQVGAGYRAAGAAQDAKLDHVEGAQGGLATQLNNVIAGRAPSVAGTMLAQNQDATTRQILGQAAGVSGPSSYDARRAAINAIAASRTATAGNAALTRATEVNNATTQLGGVLNSQAAGLQARQNTNVGAGSDYTKTAATGEAGQQGMNAEADKDNQANNTARYGATINGLAGGAKAAFGG